MSLFGARHVGDVEMILKRFGVQSVIPAFAGMTAAVQVRG